MALLPLQQFSQGFPECFLHGISLDTFPEGKFTCTNSKETHLCISIFVSIRMSIMGVISKIFISLHKVQGVVTAVVTVVIAVKGMFLPPHSALVSLLVRSLIYFDEMCRMGQKVAN